jgi:hypothetical protein
VVQLADLPSVEHGPLYRLLGDTPEIGDAAQTASGPLTRPDGTVEGVTLAIRSGGPVVGFEDAIELMAADPRIMLGEASTAQVIRLRDVQRTTAVIALSERSHDIVLWDPATYPSVDGFESLASLGVEIRHFPDEPFIDFLEATGPLSGADLVDEYLGEPAAFVAAAGSIAQQGDALVDPFLFSTLPQWSKPVEYAFAADAGWDSYDDTLVARSDELDDLDFCLGRLVPVLQDSMVAHFSDPSPTNELIASLRARFNPLTRSSVELLDLGTEAGRNSGIFENGSDGVIGSFDLDRLDTFLDELGNPDVAGADIATNGYVAVDRAL